MAVDDATKIGKVSWNKGLKKGDHPSIERMGFQKGYVVSDELRKKRSVSSTGIHITKVENT